MRGEAVHYPISLDATASGAQLLAIASGCEATARLCNVIDTGNREDLYTNAHQLMEDRLGCATSQVSSSTVITRDDAKQAIMTSLYGSQKQPRRIFGESEKLEIFYQTMEEELPGAWGLNKALIGLWQPFATEHEWLLPDNFHVRIKVMTPVEHTFELAGQNMTAVSHENVGTESGLSLSANVVHSLDGLVVREVLRRCAYDSAKLEGLMSLLVEMNQKGSYTTSGSKSPNHELVETLWGHYLECGFLSSRILEVLDAENIHLVNREVISSMIATLPEKPFQVLSVHDCFRVHPNYGNDLRKQYNQILHDLAKSTILAFIVHRIAGQRFPVTKLSENLADHVLEANYALS